MEQRRFVVLDVETTGNSPKKGEKIIQFGAVVIENGAISERFMSYVNPLQPIPAFIEALTGINDEMVNQAPVFSEIAEKVFSLLDGAWFVAHNVHFDLSFVQAELVNAGFPRFIGGLMDTVELSRMMFPSLESYKLSDLCKELNIEHDRPHQADSDAEATAEILTVILSRLEELPAETLKSLRKLSDVFISDLHEILDDLIENALSVPAAEKDANCELFGSLAFSKVFTEPDPEPGPQAENEVSGLLPLNRLMEEKMADYEDRPQQQKLMKEVYQSLASHEHMVAEAPAGSGKSLALLLPALVYATENQSKVVYSTHTTALQHQLLERDTKIAGEILSADLSACILKGESHYICPHKFEMALMETDENYDSNLAKAQILIWLLKTRTGDADELNLPSGGRNLWQRIHHDRTSGHPKNPYRDRSFYHLARERAEKSTIIIVNHALLLNDAAAGKKQLPEFDAVMIDEAHHLERAAGDQWGFRLEYVTIHSWLQRLGHMYSGDLLAYAAGWFERENEKGYDYCLELDVLLKEFYEELNDFYTSLHSYVLRKKSEEANRISIVIEHDENENLFWSAIEELADRIRFYMLDIITIMEKQKRLLDTDNLPMAFQVKMNEYFSYADRFRQAGEAIQSLFKGADSENACWIEAEAKGAKNAAVICGRPVDVSEKLASSLFEKKRSVILVSATLTVNGSFQHAVSQLGLHDFYPKQLILPSPFDMKKQAQLFVPSDIPAIREVSLETYTTSVAFSISEFAPMINGKILVLFTSYDMLKNTYQHLKSMPAMEEYTILGQGVSSGSKGKLIKSFRQTGNAILLGTNSFWEGIDFPGEELKAIIMIRLPFAPPDQPVMSAKLKKLDLEGKNAFYEYSLPEAILRFKQGFGRLIRTERDKGLLIVLDRRILTSRYGQYFIKAIPGLDVHYKPVRELAAQASQWFSE
ncbi:ATP-dependent DNA helicase DinG [Metabacillus sp. 84]|uniref:ATP-dependent DNA helicase DinG n=1 Tax=unclassified Metabacillus TaxID=2675274 RepID=UPI003CF4A3CB